MIEAQVAYRKDTAPPILELPFQTFGVRGGICNWGNEPVTEETGWMSTELSK